MSSDEEEITHSEMAIHLLKGAIDSRYDSRSKKGLIEEAIKEIKLIPNKPE